LAVKKFGEKAAANDWQKKLWQMLTSITHHQSSIKVKRSQTKKFQTLMNIIK